MFRPLSSPGFTANIHPFQLVLAQSWFYFTFSTYHFHAPKIRVIFECQECVVSLGEDQVCRAP